jgi:prevent-host-death family protein
MKSQVRIAEFKNHLSRYLRAAQRGREIIIKDRDTPIARLLPIEKPSSKLEIRPATGSLRDLDKLPVYAPEGLTLQDLEDAIRETKRDRLGDIIDRLP